MNKTVVMVLAGLGVAWQVLSGGAKTPDPVELSVREQNLARVRESDLCRSKEYEGQSHFMVRPGLLADRTGRVVRVMVESIRLPVNAPVEFPLITATSGKDYEAHAVAFATARDIHEALQFIGLTPGHGVDSAQLRFWPRGDRVAVTFHYRPPGATADLQVPATQLTLDTRTGKTLPDDGFVFTGSEWVEVFEPATGKVYAADAFSPNCIISHYNEGSTVLDVPRKDSQNAVYTYQVPNPAFQLPSNQLIEVTLAPYFKDDSPRCFDFALKIAPPASTGTTELVYILQDKTGRTVNSNATLGGVLDVLGPYTGAGREAFVTVLPDEQLPLAAMQKVARLLEKLDTERGLRIEAPPPGHPYFRAFLPNEQHRRREERPAVAAELILAAMGGGATGTLVLIDMTWESGDAKPVFTETRRAIPSADKVVPAILAKEEPPTVVLIFAPPSMTYGVVREFMVPLLGRKMIVYVFMAGG